MSRLRNDMNKRTFYKERQINNRWFDFLSKQKAKVQCHREGQPWFDSSYGLK